MLFGFFSKMKNTIYRKVRRNESGLYSSVLFPIMFAFILTFVGSRIISIVDPSLHLFSVDDGVRVHHYTYGIFILAVSGYLALTLNGPKATFLIALLHGFGLGLAFDELGMWLKLRDDDIARWSYDGFNIIIGLSLLILTFKPGIKRIKHVFSSIDGGVD